MKGRTIAQAVADGNFYRLLFVDGSDCIYPAALTPEESAIAAVIDRPELAGTRATVGRILQLECGFMLWEPAGEVLLPERGRG